MTEKKTEYRSKKTGYRFAFCGLGEKLRGLCVQFKKVKKRQKLEEFLVSPILFFFSKKLKINTHLTPASPFQRGGGEVKENMTEKKLGDRIQTRFSRSWRKTSRSWRAI